MNLYVFTNITSRKNFLLVMLSLRILEANVEVLGTLCCACRDVVLISGPQETIHVFGGAVDDIMFWIPNKNRTGA